MKNKSFSVKQKKIVFSKGPIRLVDCQVKMSDGKILSRQILEHPGSVVIIPRLSKSKFYLIRQFRFAVRDWLWEWPAGGIEKGETQRQAAKRELTEEIGFRPRRLKKLIDIYPTPGVSGETMHLFLAEDLTPCRGEPDEDEAIELHSFSKKEVWKMICQGKIQDAKTLLGFLYLTKMT